VGAHPDLYIWKMLNCFYVKVSQLAATTFNIMTLTIMTQTIMTLSIMTLGIMTMSITVFDTEFFMLSVV
jgi:hypothetical protein